MADEDIGSKGDLIPAGGMAPAAVTSYTQKTRQPGIRLEILGGIPKEIEEYIIGLEETCSQCGGELKVIGKKVV